MSKVGQRLRETREQREITLDQVAKGTKIRAGYLRALEKGDYSELPGSTFNKGFVQSYAMFLGLDPKPLVLEYVQEEAELMESGSLPEQADVLDELRVALDSHPAGAGEVLKRALPILVPSVVLIALVAAGLFVLPSSWLAYVGIDTRPEPAPVTNPASPGPAATTDPTPAETPAPAPATTLPTDQPAVAAAPSNQESPDASGAGKSESTTPDATSATQPSIEQAAQPAADEPVRQPEPIAAPVPDTSTNTNTLKIADSGVGTDVVDRDLVGQSDRFALGTSVVFWTRAVGGAKGDTLRHVWIYEGQAVGTSSLSIGGSHWRTYSRRPMEPGSAGNWAVEARSADGTLLARHTFTCE